MSYTKRQNRIILLTEDLVQRGILRKGSREE